MKSIGSDELKKLRSGSKAVGRVITDDGYIDISDKDTFEIAKMYLKLIAKRLKIEEDE